jgi:hypothetical protein
MNDKLALLTEQMKAEQKVLLKVAEGQKDLAPLIEKIGNLGDVLSQPKSSDDENGSKTHLRNIDHSVTRLVTELTSGREQMLKELRSEIKLLAKTVAASSGRSDTSD